MSISFHTINNITSHPRVSNIPFTDVAKGKFPDIDTTTCTCTFILVICSWLSVSVIWGICSCIHIYEFWSVSWSYSLIIHTDAWRSVPATYLPVPRLHSEIHPGEPCGYHPRGDRVRQNHSGKVYRATVFRMLSFGAETNKLFSVSIKYLWHWFIYNKINVLFSYKMPFS